MGARQVRLSLFEGDDPATRFAHPGWRRSRRPSAPEAPNAASLVIDSTARSAILVGSFAHDHPRLHAVVEAIRTRLSPGTELVLETDASDLAPCGRAERLLAAGVVAVRLWMGGIRSRVHATMMRLDDGVQAALDGVRAAARAGLRTWVLVPLLDCNADDTVPLAERLASIAPRPEGLLLAPPSADTVPASLHALLASPAQIAELAARLFERARRLGLSHGFAHAGLGPPPCAGRALDAFPATHHAWLEHVRNEHRVGAPFRRIDACGVCALRRTCPGIPVGRYRARDEADLRPVPEDVALRWPMPPRERPAEDYRNVSPFVGGPPGERRAMLRVNGHCPMRCAFCFVDRSVGDFETAALQSAIDAMARAGADHLVLSGGEPTIHPDLPALVAHARARGLRVIEIQTNGVRCADEGYARRLVDAGLNKATVSLHAFEASRSDDITGMRGAFERTVEGLRRLRALGVQTQIAHVITRRNVADLPDFARWVARTFLPGPHLSICFAVAQRMSDLVAPWLVPSFREVREPLRAALDVCDAAGIGYGGLIGQGGVPPCVLDGDLHYYRGNLGRVYLSPDWAEQFTKPPRCRDCSFDPYCVGVRRDHLALHGEDELRPFQAPPEAFEGARPLPSSRPLAPAEGSMAAAGLVRIRRRASHATANG
ncbi:MAG: radical SAM protein [Myxococcota bacterium]|nr:radical SAM protein [Myxococcota bacterium]MDW8362216.1 radical SAM protein [Myxococcales bacterium]